MKILYLCADLGIPVLGRKGASVHVRELVAAFERAGHEVVLAAQTLNKSPWEAPAEVGRMPLHVRLAPGSVGAVFALKAFSECIGAQTSLPGEMRRILYNQDLHADLSRRFDDDPPDFIYERASLYGTAGVTLARELQVPLLLELNAPLAAEQNAYRATGFGDLAARAESWTLQHADALLVVSSELRQHALQLGVEPRRIHVIPNGVDPNRFCPGAVTPELRKRWRLANGPVLGFLGGLRPWHGVEVLPDLLQRLLKNHPRLQLVVAGAGQMRPDLEKDFASRGLQRHVVWVGTVAHDQVSELIRAFDVAVAPYPALNHSFYFSPLKIFEYMACGTAVVAPRLGQIAEVIRHAETGLLYPAGDLHALQAACERLLADRKLRSRLGRGASKFIRANFTWDRNAARVAEAAQGLRRAPRAGI